MLQFYKMMEQDTYDNYHVSSLPSDNKKVNKHAADKKLYKYNIV